MIRPQARGLGSVAAVLCALLMVACATAPPAAPLTAAPPSSPPVPVVTATPVAVSASAPLLAVAGAPAASAPEPTAVAEAPVDPLRPGVTVDLNDGKARGDLWQRIRDGFGIPDLDDGFVRKREYYYASRPEYVQRMTDRGTRYLFHIVEEVQRRGLPTELALLPFIESAFNPEAMSSARASGMWQFMPATGRHFDLTQNVFRDDRRDVLASTRAALDYLTKLHAMFGDWHLALAAYNWGEGSVQRAIRANQRAGMPTDYASLKMPAETRDYVPKLQAVKNIVANPASYTLSLPPLENHPYFLSVPIGRDIDVALAARLAGMPLDEFKALNPQMNKPVILAAGTPQVLLPYANADRFIKSVPEHKGPFASWTAWTAPRTMKPAEAAKQAGMSEGDLRAVNAIPPHMLVKAGSTLLVPRGRHREDDVSGRVAANAVLVLSPEGPALRRVTLRAGKKGESVAALAKRYRVSAQQVALWNKVGAEAHFPAGSTVVMYVANKSPSNSAPRSKAKVRSTRQASAAAPTRTR